MIIKPSEQSYDMVCEGISPWLEKRTPSDWSWWNIIAQHSGICRLKLLNILLNRIKLRTVNKLLLKQLSGGSPAFSFGSRPSTAQQVLRSRLVTWTSCKYNHDQEFHFKVCWWQLFLSSERARKCNQILPKGCSGEPTRTLLSLSLPTSSPLLKVSPNFAYAYTLLGHEYVLVEELEKALACFRFAWQITLNLGET